MNFRRDDLLARIIMFVSMLFCGMFIGTQVDVMELSESLPGGAFGLLLLTVGAIAAAVFVQSIVHELGHLVCGLLSGYSFTSFRIGRIMIIKESGRLKGKIYNLVGTGGQCLMMPPLWREGIPYRLYNFGGCLANLTASGLLLVLSNAAEKGSAWNVLCIVTAAVGFMTALMNGIPLRPGGIANDGYNAFVMGRNPTAVRAFWLQLYVNGLISAGERIHNLPEEWFFLPSGDDMDNPLICGIGVFRYNYWFDAHDFEKAEETAEYMLKTPGLLGIHRNELLCELLFCRVLRGADPSEIDSLLTPELNKYIKMTASYVSRKRLSFAYFYLYKKQYDTALKCREAFERTCRTYPYSSEIENEEEIVEMISAMDPDAR